LFAAWLSENSIAEATFMLNCSLDMAKMIIFAIETSHQAYGTTPIEVFSQIV
jgi:hypothetical protein